MFSKVLNDAQAIATIAPSFKNSPLGIVLEQNNTFTVGQERSAARVIRPQVGTDGSTPKPR